MKLTLTATDLSTAATWADRIAPSKPRVPLTAGVLITATAEGLTFAATNFDVFATGTSTGLVDEPGWVVVSAAGLARVAKALLPTSNPVIAESDGKHLVLRCGRLRAGLPVLPADDWPVFPVAGDPIGSIPGSVLATALSRVSVAALPPTESPPHFTGVLLDTTQGATLVATDGVRMATSELDWQPALGVEPDRLIIPVELFRGVVDANSDGDVSLHSDGSTISLVAPRLTVTGRLHAGQYPQWRPLMDGPESSLATSVSVDTEALSRAVAQVSAASTPNAKVPDLVKLTIGPEEIGVDLVTGKDADDGKDGFGDTAVELHSIAGEPITIGASHQYLLDALAAMGSPMTIISLTDDPTKPFGLRPATAEGQPLSDGYRHLLIGRKLREPA